MDPRSGSVLVQAVPQEVLGERTVSTTRHAIVSGASAAGIVAAGSWISTNTFVTYSALLYQCSLLFACGLLVSIFFLA